MVSKLSGAADRTGGRAGAEYRRPLLEVMRARVEEPRRFIQIFAGPRQTGKTTLAHQLLTSTVLPSHYASADDPALQDAVWLRAQWDIGRLRAAEGNAGAVLVLDEIQKIPSWSDIVKRLWDEDTAAKIRLRAVLLGSSPLLIQRGLTESLAGRFELVSVPHWSFEEIHDAFGWSLDQYLYFGAYPGAAPLVGNEDRWRRYVLDALIEPSISRDILLLTRVDKPALLRQLFRLGCDYSGQVVSYQKLVGQLQDAGNTTTLAHYLNLLAGAGLMTGLHKYSGAQVRTRGSSPKLLVLNTALMNAMAGDSLDVARADPNRWGRIVESSAGAHLVNGLTGTGAEVEYWRERSLEVDFVVRRGREAVAVEVTTGRRKDTASGLDEFVRRFAARRRLLVGGQGIPLREFFASPPLRWLGPAASR